MLALNEHELLQEADRHIAEWRKLIGRQKLQISDLQREGHDAVGSINLLCELERSLRSMRNDRGVIARRLKRRDPS